MKSLYKISSLAALLTFLTLPANAHHSAGHATSLNSFNPYSSQTRTPESFVDFNFNYDHLDGGLGYVLTYQIAGEYAVNRRLSIGARLPIISVRESFLPKADNVGDIALSVKGLVADWSDKRMFLNLGTEVSLPTGKESKGTGTGNLVFSPFATLSKSFSPMSLIFSAGTTFSAASQVNPSINYASTVVVPVIKSILPTDILLAFQGTTTTSSDTFKSGSTQAYLKPAVTVHIKEKLLATVGAKLAVIDTLSLKPGITLANQSTAPLSDINTGFFLDLNYSF